MKKRIALIITTLGLLTFAAVASLMPGFTGSKLEVKELNGQVELIMKKTTNLKNFKMAEVKL